VQAGRLAARCALASPVQVAKAGQAGFFLLQLFRQVIFADKDLVTHYASRQRMRVMYGAFFAAALLLGTALGGWSWSYLANRQLVNNVQADLDKVVRLQASAPICRLGWKLWRYCRTGWNSWNATVASGVEAGYGLYQGDALEAKLRASILPCGRVMLAPWC
jgi:type VI secretion system protein ImpL